MRYDDKLAELEALIRDWFIAKGYATEKEKWFYIEIELDYKEKVLRVHRQTEEYMEEIFKTKQENTKNMLDKTFEYFRIKG